MKNIFSLLLLLSSLTLLFTHIPTQSMKTAQGIKRKESSSEELPATLPTDNDETMIKNEFLNGELAKDNNPNTTLVRLLDEDKINSTDDVTYLLEHNATVNSCYDDTKQSALMAAVVHSKTQSKVNIVKFLIEHNANLESADNEKRAALAYAITTIYGTNTIKLLLAAGSDIGSLYGQRVTTYDHHRTIQVEEIIADHKTDLEKLFRENEHASCIAIKDKLYGKLPIIELILDYTCYISWNAKSTKNHSKGGSTIYYVIE